MHRLRWGVSGDAGELFRYSYGPGGDTSSGWTRCKVRRGCETSESYRDGVGNAPRDVSRALVNKMAGGDEMNGHDIARQLTEEYGGELLYNALRISRLVGTPNPHIRQIEGGSIP